MIVTVVGTGTDVGKTFVTAALGAALRRHGVDVSAWKPVASGVPAGEEASDASALAAAVGRPIEPPRHVFLPPISPHLAARHAGVRIDVEDLVAHARRLAASCEVLLVETAGGLFSPLSDEATNASLVGALGGAWVLVAPDRLGVLHDVGATLRAARAEGLGTPAALVLSAASEPDASSGTNEAEIARVTGQPVTAVFPRGERDEAAVDQAAHRVWAALSTARTPRGS